MAWPAVGLVGGGEATAASQPAMGGRSTRHDRRWFGRLAQEDQRLKKHYGHWMDIIDHAAPRAPGRWTTARPRKGTAQSQGRHSGGCRRVEEYEGSLVWLWCEAVVAAEYQGVWVSRGMAWPAVGVVGGGEASVEA